MCEYPTFGSIRPLKVVVSPNLANFRLRNSTINLRVVSLPFDSVKRMGVCDLDCYWISGAKNLNSGLVFQKNLVEINSKLITYDFGERTLTVRLWRLALENIILPTPSVDERPRRCSAWANEAGPLPRNDDDSPKIV